MNRETFFVESKEKEKKGWEIMKEMSEERMRQKGIGKGKKSIVRTMDAE